MHDPDLAVPNAADEVPDEEGVNLDQEVREIVELLDEFEQVKEMPDPPPEKFYPINRAARRDAERRNRALKKRRPNG